MIKKIETKALSMKLPLETLKNNENQSGEQPRKLAPTPAEHKLSKPKVARHF